MAKVSLRIYNREIEGLVDRGQLDEAIAHCRHILNTFPKNLETYRLIGKAYLEAKRYKEATNIFDRVLMAVPDDFVAHVGMSIIHDEQKEMDAAIWHMERAFEVQPSNAAIQSELQRLFGRRDGVEPPKIRLTRGALAHMYVQGELYPQAISEIKAVLEEDRERQDMQVLLARAYFHSGQKSEAAEMCSQLLRRYPYCLDANRVLVELLPETERGESTQVYRKRVNELDPYAAFVTGSVFHTDEIPDAAVSLERLDWTGQPVEMGPEWSESMGIGLGEKTAAEDEEPDWLKSGLASGSFGASASTASSPQGEESASVSGGLPIPSAGGEDEIPEFLRKAGWGEDTGTFQEGLGVFDSSDESQEPALAEGDLPDWVKAMAPTGANIQESTPQAGANEDLEQGDIPDWLQGLGDEQGAPSDEQPAAEQSPLEGDLPDWLESTKPREGAVRESQPQEQMMADSTSDDDLPDWLKSIKSEEEGTEPGETPQEIPSEPTEEVLPESQPQGQAMADSASDEDLPDWLKSIRSGEEGAEPGEIPQEAPSEPVEEVLPESQPQEQVMAEASSDEDLFDWLKSMQSEEEGTEPGGVPQEMPSEPVEEILPEAQPQEQMMAEATSDEALPDWLKAIQSDEGQATPEEMPSEATMEPEQEVPEMGEESLSDWQISEEATAESVAFDATDTGGLGTSADEQDDAIAWLEGLAAKHGAKPEELVTKPEDRTETEPEWVQRAKATQEQAGAETPVSNEQPSAEVPTDLPGFLSEERAEPVEETGAEAPADLPEFLAKEHAVPAEEVGAEAGPIDVSSLGTSAEEQEDAVAWLESLAAKHGAKPEELVTDPNARKETAPEWVQKAAEASTEKLAAEEVTPVEEPMEPEPEWLEPAEHMEEAPSVEMEGAQAEEPVSPARIDETGMWLRDMGEEGAFEEQPELTDEAEPSAAEGDLPEWLREMEGETAETGVAPKSEEEAPLPDWLRDLEEAPSEAESVPASLSEEEAVSEPEREVVSKIDINTASIEEMAELPGIGDLLAQNIVAYRETYGDFSSVDDLSNIAGIGPSTIDELRGLVEFREVEATAQSEEAEAAEWLQSLEAEASTTEAEETFAEETASEGLPSWLAGLDEEKEQPQPAMDIDSGLPEWLRDVEEQQRPAEPEPTAPADWTPAAEPSQEEPTSPTPAPEPEVEEPTAQAAAQPAPEPEPAPESKSVPQAPPEREPYREPVTRSRTGMTGMLSAAQDPDLTGAQIELTRGNIPGAMDSYGKLIKKGKLLDEIVFDLREALYLYPVEVSILQTLGDAYMRANRLQDALDSYTKAEELLR
jgi:competence ComEA-like helix-hairpin-helix protein